MQFRFYAFSGLLDESMLFENLQHQFYLLAIDTLFCGKMNLLTPIERLYLRASNKWSGDELWISFTESTKPKNTANKGVIMYHTSCLFLWKKKLFENLLLWTLVDKFESAFEIAFHQFYPHFKQILSISPQWSVVAEIEQRISTV